ncbi:MAG: hypothetical protein ACI9P7_000811 [Candidatus Azotimanducaceae bacterium]|jgi:hypothetical protein
MKGSCNCGAVSFEVSGNLPLIYKCQCSLCRKQGGGTSNAATIVEFSKLDWLTGVDSISKWKKQTGFSSDFCKVCGSPVPNPIVDAKYMWIPMGLIDDAVSASVAALIFCDSKATWDETNSSLVSFSAMPEDMEEFISQLNSN